MVTPLELVRQVFDPESAVRLVQEVVRIPSINGYEGDVGRCFLEAMSARGLQAEIQPVEGDRFNVIGRLRGEQPGPTLLFQGHVDTVPGYSHPEPFGGAVRDGKIWGRGASDMKGPLATVVEAAGLVALLGRPLRGELIVVATVDEESQKKGISQLVKSGVRADLGVNVEPTDLRIALGQKGCVSVRVTTFGRAGHGAAPWRGLNAIGKMAKVVGAIEALPPRSLDVPGVGAVHSSYNVGVIRGGEQFFVVPDRCSIWIDRRTVPGETRDDVLGELRGLIDRLTADDPDLKAEVVYERQDWDWAPIIARGTHACLISPDEPVVRQLEAAGEAVLGHRPLHVLQDAWCETDFLVNDAGIPTVNFGPGKMELAHSSEEHIEVEQVHQAVQIYALLMLGVLGT